MHCGCGHGVRTLLAAAIRPSPTQEVRCKGEKGQVNDMFMAQPGNRSLLFSLMALRLRLVSNHMGVMLWCSSTAFVVALTGIPRAWLRDPSSDFARIADRVLLHLQVKLVCQVSLCEAQRGYASVVCGCRQCGGPMRSSTRWLRRSEVCYCALLGLDASRSASGATWHCP